MWIRHGGLNIRFANEKDPLSPREADCLSALSDRLTQRFCSATAKLSVRLLSNPIRHSGLESFLEINDSAKGVHKISETAGRQHNGIASPTHILGDLKKTPTLILFQVEKENFSIHLNFFGGERIIRSVGCITVNHSLL